MFRNAIAVIIALSVITFSCNDDEVQINDSVKIDYVYTLQNQQIDSISVYTHSAKIYDSNLAEKAAEQAERNFSYLQFPKDVSYTADSISFTFLSNSVVEFASATKELEVYDFKLTDNFITVYGDTLVTYGYDEKNKDYYDTQYINQIGKYKPLIFSQENVIVGYTEALETKVINEHYFYREGDQIIEPRIFYVHITSFEGSPFTMKNGGINNEIAQDAFKVLNPGDSLLVYHFSRIYQ